tara:strand:+ start:377 stop:1225 length:849 start_codon:yes stop_codon:yes gene_type:complete
MAKKQTKAAYQGDPGDEHVETVVAVKETLKPVVEKPKVEKQTWEIKDRTYLLNNNKSPLTYTIKSTGIYYFDKEKGYERELKYTRNQKTPFVDEFPEGSQQRLDHIVFTNGVLLVEKEKTTLQKLLSLYHPHKGSLYHELDRKAKAQDEVEDLEFEIEALNAAMNMDVDMAEAIMRVEIGSKVSKMNSKELKRDLLLYAKNNPDIFLELANDDNVVLRNFGIKATELGLLKLSTDQRTFSWGSNGRKLMNVPFDEHPYNALAAWFKTDEGMEIYTNIEKQLK